MINVKNVVKSYNGELVLRGVSFDIADGEFVSIMGESGSGKSTLLSIIGGLLDADEGAVLIDGQDISLLDEGRMSAMRCDSLGFVFQSFKLIPTLNVWDNLLLPATLGGKSSKETREYVKALAAEFSITDTLDKFPEQLSGGQCQRVAIIRALAYKPSLLILDEPTGALDSKTEAKVMEVLVRLNRECGTTVVQVTHSKKVAEYGSRIILLSDGEVCQ